MNKIPDFGLGTWRAEPNEVGNAVKEALQIGYKHIDCAHIYNNESEIGDAFKSSFSSGINRNDIWITSKLWNDSHRPEHVKDALKLTLSRLQLDHLDLYLIHWPIAFNHGIVFPENREGYLTLNEVPVIETWQAMEECVKDGLVKQIGVANFSVSKLTDLNSKSDIKPSVNQVEIHPYFPQNDLKKYCDNEDIVLTAYSPLGNPGLDRNPENPKILQDQQIKQIADSLKVSPAQVLIKWAIQRGTSVIPKSSNPNRLKENFEAQQIELSSEDMDIINSLDRDLRYIDGSFFTQNGSPYTLDDIWG